MPFPSKEEVVYNLQHPEKAPFPVTFELFTGIHRRDVARTPPSTEQKTATKLNGISDEDFDWMVNAFKKRQNALDHQLVNGYANDVKKYQKIKAYFVQKCKETGLTEPLVFFDDKALRVDIGYGPLQFQAIFSDFLDRGGLFDTEVLNGTSILGPAPGKYFNDYFMSQNYEQSLQDEVSELCSRPINPVRKETIRLDLAGCTEQQLIQKILANHAGFCLGEGHTDKSPKQFLVDNMGLFKAGNVTTLYMEHLLHDPHQAMLDAYLHTPDGTALPKVLALYLDKLDRQHHLSGTATFTNVVTAAKKFGIRIVAIDTEATYRTDAVSEVSDFYKALESTERIKSMNVTMLDRFKKYDDGKKFVAFMGSAHVTTCKGIPGVSAMLGCPNVLVADITDNLKETMDVNAQELNLHYDVLYHRHVKAKVAAEEKKSDTADKQATNPERLFTQSQPAEAEGVKKKDMPANPDPTDETYGM